MFGQNRVLLIQISRPLYYAVMFISFTLVFIYADYILTFVNGYLPETLPALAIKFIGYLILYILAAVALPEFFGYLYRKMFLER